MTTHEKTAREIAREIAREMEIPLSAGSSARQGDLILVRTGNSKVVGPPTRPGGIVLATGMHGEHRLIADAVTVSKEWMDLPFGGLVVHTDVPAGRHQSIRCAPGKWSLIHQREVAADMVVRRVQD